MFFVRFGFFRRCWIIIIFKNVCYEQICCRFLALNTIETRLNLQGASDWKSFGRRWELISHTFVRRLIASDCITVFVCQYIAYWIIYEFYRKVSAITGLCTVFGLFCIEMSALFHDWFPQKSFCLIKFCRRNRQLLAQMPRQVLIQVHIY